MIPWGIAVSMEAYKNAWHGKPYYSLDAYCKNTFGHKCYKIALNAHMTCPNRDGRLGVRGCIFCSAGGSGEFAVSTAAPDASQPFMKQGIGGQLREGLALFGDKKVGSHFIAYFQAYTNTYAPPGYLEQVYTEALECPDVCGISIATRPDCLPLQVLGLLARLKERYPGKFIWLELGLQTIHERTARWMRRGYALPCFEEAFGHLRELGIPVIVHLILGLPGETALDVLESVGYLNTLRPFGVKLQLLHVLRGTDLERCYLAGEVKALTKEEYLDLLILCLEHLDPGIVVHRVTGDGAKRELLAPLWSANKRDVLNSLHRRMREKDTCQGAAYDRSTVQGGVDYS